MKLLVRLCLGFGMCVMDAALAGLETVWSERFTSATLEYNVQQTRLDGSGNVIIAGTITEMATGSDIWVAKLDGVTGDVIWSARKDGLAKANDKLGNIIVSADGDIYVAGGVVNDIGSNGVPDYDVYLARLKGANGAEVWEHYGAGNVGDDAWHDIALDADGNVVVTGVLTILENSLGGQVWTANYEPVEGGLNWERQHNALEAGIHDQGERLFIAANGDIYVQGSHQAGNILGTDYGQTVQVVSYTRDGTFRWGERIREAPGARAYGYMPSIDGGYVIGLSEVVLQANATILTVAKGRADGRIETEVTLPNVTSAPFLVPAENLDILFGGRMSPVEGPVTIVAGRLAPGDLSTLWVQPLPGQGAGSSTAFGHVDFLDGGSVVAGIAPGPNTQDLAIGIFTKEGANSEKLFLDGSADGTEVPDLLPGGPAIDSDAAGRIAVAVTTLTEAEDREVLVRLLRPQSTSTPPVITVTSPDAASLSVEAFANFTFSVEAMDPDGDPFSVEFFADGVSLGVLATGPFQVTHAFASTGTHMIEAIATDLGGLSSSTGPITMQATVPMPVPTTGGAVRTGPATGEFSGSVENLPFGGKARFVFRYAGPSIGFGFSTASVDVPANAGAQTITIPFDIPEPHRSYDYFLEVAATDGGETVTAGSPVQTFTVPNAPVLAAPDFFFAPRGTIVGAPASNDLDADPGEVLAVTYDPGPFPGVFTIKPGSFAFAPGRDFTGELVLNYTVDDGHGSVVTESITIRNARYYAGVYRALSPVTGARLGAVDVTVNRSGRATVVAYVEGKRFTAAGELQALQGDEVGFSTPLRKQLQPDRLLRLTWSSDRQLTVELREGESVVYSAQGSRAVISEFPLPQVYTLLGSHSNIAGNAAGRVSAFASVQLAPNGTATIRGSLGDGTPFVTKARGHEDGRVAVYSPLRGRKSSFLLGRLQTNADDAVSVGPGFAAVQGPATPRVPEYATGYVDLVGFAGPRYVPPIVGGSPLTFTQSPLRIMLESSGGGITPVSFSIPVWTSRTGGVSGIIGITRVSIDARTGELKGAFLPQGRRRTLPFSGILRADMNGAIGVFRGAPSAGEVTLSPE